MLCLTRKRDQSVTIDRNIVVKVLKITGTTVKLGFTAPDGISILRTEIIEREDDAADAA